MSTEVTNMKVATEVIQKIARKPQVPATAQAAAEQATVADGRQVVSGATAKDGKIFPSESQSNSSQNEPVKEDVKKAVRQINDFVQSLQRDLHFQVDDTSGRIVIEVIDSETKELIRTIPPKEALNLADLLNNTLPDGSGLLLRDQA